jgi:uncharacterized protein (TIGR03435 family)
MIRSLLTLILASAAFGAGPAFEVASIRPAEPGRGGVQVLPGAVTLRSQSLAAIVRWAYDINEIELSGPGWINETFFDVSAKAAAPAKEAELRVMMRTLLADRFHLESHRQSKELSALILTVGKTGHKLKEVQEEGSPSFQTGKLNLTGRGATVAQLTKFLSHELRQPVVDQTGLAGRYDYFLDINKYVTEEMRNQPGPPAEAPTIIAQALQSQLGLRVDAKKATIEILVVDKLEKTPTDN